MYILDTSALRGISKDKLKLASEKHRIASSTLSVLEIASHLNDSSEDSAFSRVRGNLLKCQIPEILDDPFHTLAENTSIFANQTRGEERIMLLQLIGAIEQSTSITELENKTLTYPDGRTTSFKNIGKILSGLLKDDEEKYVDQVKLIASLTKPDPSLNGKHCLDDDNFFTNLTSTTKALSKSNHQTDLAETFLKLGPYCGYIIYRLYEYINKLPPGEEKLRIDPNDCEDAFIILHLDLNNDNCLVTNDKGTIKALTKTIEVLKNHLPLPDSNHVMSCDEFLELIDSNTAA